MKLTDLRHQNFRYLRLRNRIRPQKKTFTEPPERPVGVKLELTYACNLRCAFCYTDSPRRTLQRSTDLSDEAWHKIVDEAIDLGIVEAVVTGGEPLLRKDLTLDLIERMAKEGIGIAFNTNGWFVDAEVADRLRNLQSVTVHLSLDGSAPHLHDASRGVPGSWRRAVEGIDHLLSAGVNLCVVHVITPENVDYFPQMLEEMWTLGVPWIRPTPVVISGAAARGGDWAVSREALARTVREFKQRRGTAMKIDLRPGSGASLALQGEHAPGSMLVRPAGAVRTDSLRPFSYGNAARDGLAGCWEQVRTGWADERVKKWADAMKESSDIGSGDLVPYLDDEQPIALGDEPTTGESSRTMPVPAPAPLKPFDPDEDFAAASEKIRDLAMSRRYRLQPVRTNGGSPRIVRRVADGSYRRLNASAGVVMDALDGGTPADAMDALVAQLDAPPESARIDALAATRQFLEIGIVASAAGAGFAPSLPGPSDLPGMEPTGDDV